MDPFIPDDDWLDAEQLPFTFDEVLEAARVWLPEEEALEITQAVGADAREYWNYRCGRQIPFRPEFGRIGEANTQVPWLWPTLSVLSQSCAVRVSRWMDVYWPKLLLRKINEISRRLSSELRVQNVGGYVARAVGPTSIEEVRERLEQARALEAEEMKAIVLEADAFISSAQSSWAEIAEEAKARMRRFRDLPPSANVEG